ncbi:unnamed protein product [Urochloa humidicola]
MVLPANFCSCSCIPVFYLSHAAAANECALKFETHGTSVHLAVTVVAQP